MCKQKNKYWKFTFQGSVQMQSIKKKITNEKKKQRYMRAKQIESSQQRKNTILKRQEQQQNQQILQKQQKIQRLLQIQRQIQQIRKQKQSLIIEQQKAQEKAQKEQLQRQKNAEQKQIKKQKNIIKAKQRYADALERTRCQQIQNTYDKTKIQALGRRKVYDDVAVQERQKVVEYKENLMNQAMTLQKSNKNYQNFDKNLPKSIFLKGFDYSKSCIHNPLVVRSIQQNENAMIKAYKQEEMLEAQKQKRNQLSENRDRKKQQYSRNAFRKLAQQKALEQYCRQVQAKSLQRKMKILQQGKKYSSVRPGTLLQQQISKKERNEAQFQEKFFGEKAQWLSQSIHQQTINNAYQQMDSSKSRVQLTQKISRRETKPLQIQTKIEQFPRPKKVKIADAVKKGVLVPQINTLNKQLENKTQISKQQTITKKPIISNQRQVQTHKQTERKSPNLSQVRKLLQDQKQFLNNLDQKYQMFDTNKKESTNNKMRKVIYSGEFKNSDKKQNELDYSQSQQQPEELPYIPQPL